MESFKGRRRKTGDDLPCKKKNLQFKKTSKHFWFVLISFYNLGKKKKEKKMILNLVFGLYWRHIKS